MHYRFEIPLIVGESMSNPAYLDHSDYGRDLIRAHLRRYLLNYYREHEELPTGRHYLGMTRPLHIEIGMVDFGSIRSKLCTPLAEHQPGNARPFMAVSHAEG